MERIPAKKIIAKTINQFWFGIATKMASFIKWGHHKRLQI